MDLEIAANGMELSSATRDHIERRVYFALGRFTHQVKRVHIRLADENGPKGGVDKSCRITVQLDGLPMVLVSSLATDYLSAINAAVNRSSRAVIRRIERARVVPRRGLANTA